MDLSHQAIVLINRKSGTVMSLGAEAAVKLVEENLSSRFDSITVHLFEGDVAPVLAEKLPGKEPEAVIIGGGDGTISAAAAELRGTGTVMGALPFGTMNLFVRSLGFSPNVQQALTELARAEVRDVDVGVANGRAFLHQISLGLQPRIAKLRAKIGYRSRLTKMLSGLRALAAVTINPRPVRVHLEADGEATDLRAPLLIVSNNPLGESGPVGVQARLDSGVLGLYLLKEFSAMTLFRLTRDYLAGRVRANPALDIRTAHTVKITHNSRRWRKSRRQKTMLCSIDGELVHLPSPIEITIEPKVLRVLSPKP